MTANLSAKLIITGTIADKANYRYLVYSNADFCGGDFCDFCIVPDVTYNVFGGTLNLVQPQPITRQGFYLHLWPL